MSELIWTPTKPGANAHGKVETVVYFENAHKHIIIAYSDKQPTPPNFERCEATTVREVEKLSQRMAEQQARRFASMDAEEHAKREAFFGACIARAKKTIANPMTRQAERDFLRQKLIPQWESELKTGEMFREFFFHQEAHEATHKGD